jgi:phage-related protein
MFCLAVENKNGDLLVLSNNKDYHISQIDGISSLQATVNTSVVGTFDGAIFNSSRLDMRNLGIYLAVRGNIEKSRIELYKYFPPKQWVKIYFKNGMRNVYIEGYVEDINIDPFVKPQMAQIIILCPRPFFIDVNELLVEFSGIAAMFEFPCETDDIGKVFSEIVTEKRKLVYNAGDVESGINITIHATGNITSPVVYNALTGESFRLEGLQMVAGDVLTINTNKGEKSVKLNHQGTIKNVINYRSSDSTWLELAIGDNIFTYNADSGDLNMLMAIRHSIKYLGV